MSQGYLAVVLHAHLPFVRHPEYDDFMEEDWLYEAITETYIPLLNVFEGLLRDGVHFRITMSMSPTLLAMLTDALLQERYVQHLRRLIELAEKEVQRTRNDPDFQPLARMYLGHFRDCLATFEERWDATSCAPSGLSRTPAVSRSSPAARRMASCRSWSTSRRRVRAQIQVAAADYERHFGRRPRGIWLPECGYFPGLESYLKDAGIRFFVVDAHGVLYATPRPKYATFAPLYCPNGVAAFGRDIESSKQVGARRKGYPATTPIASSIATSASTSISTTSGPTSRLATSASTPASSTGRSPDRRRTSARTGATRRSTPAARHAGNFMFNREKQFEHLFGIMGKAPIIVSPYDAELFGHWWFEGPQFLDFLVPQAALRPAHRRSADARSSISSATRAIRWRGHRSRAGATRATRSTGWKARTTGSTAIWNRPRTAWSSWPAGIAMPVASSSGRSTRRHANCFSPRAATGRSS
jgi:1,4-alpha-glucan branching enzyme